jgi:hypothetical protein
MVKAGEADTQKTTEWDQTICLPPTLLAILSVPSLMVFGSRSMQPVMSPVQIHQYQPQPLQHLSFHSPISSTYMLHMQEQLYPHSLEDATSQAILDGFKDLTDMESKHFRYAL